MLRAAAMLRPEGRGAALRLTKRLPVAAGIGGGSSDAAAALRLLAGLWGAVLPTPERLASLGADVPVCLAAVAARMQGIGERVTQLSLPIFWLVLVNPGTQIPTGAVFAALEQRDNPPLPELPLRFRDVEALVDWLAGTRNDLEPPAKSLEPKISRVLAALVSQPGCRLARMSGSGATCFGLFPSEAKARRAAETIARAEPTWWLVAAPSALGVP